jgi:hypothetical protein
LRRLALLPLALFAAPVAAHAQTVDHQLWLAANAQIALGEHDRLTVEQIGRFGDDAGGFFHAETGLLFTTRIGRDVELGLGYRHVEDWNQGRDLPNEERLRQQVTVALGGGFATRLRFEQRFNSAAPGMGLRLRPQLRFTRPLGRRVALFATHESFFNLNDTRWGQRARHERVRHTIGVTVPVMAKVSADLGYLNQYRFGRSGARDTMDHAATVALSFTL